MHYYNPMMNGYGYIGILMALFWLAITVLIVVVALRLLNRNTPTPHDKNTDSIDIAKLRYAKGEITKEQFEELKKDLT